jgi:hypothetical protein
MYFKANKSKFGKVDGLFRKVILKERPEVCDWCKNEKPCDVAHILDKGRYRKMRYVRDNVLLLCRYCHQQWHNNPCDAAAFLAKLKGVDYDTKLRFMDKAIPHCPDMKLMEILFKQELKEPHEKD